VWVRSSFGLEAEARREMWGFTLSLSYFYRPLENKGVSVCGVAYLVSFPIKLMSLWAHGKPKRPSKSREKGSTISP
jgi:hypothetical protein